MTQRTRGLMYLTGIDGDYADDPRKIVPIRDHQTRPKSRPFRIRGMKIDFVPVFGRGTTGTSGGPGYLKPGSLLVARDPSAAGAAFYSSQARGHIVESIWIDLGAPQAGQPPLSIVFGNARLFAVRLRPEPSGGWQEEVDFRFATYRPVSAPDALP